MENTRLTLCHRYSFISRAASQKRKTSCGIERARQRGTETGRKLLSFTTKYSERATKFSETGIKSFKHTHTQEIWNINTGGHGEISSRDICFFFTRQRSFVIWLPCGHGGTEEESELALHLRFAHRNQGSTWVWLCFCLVFHQPVALKQQPLILL